jgi:hypothetical protein
VGREDERGVERGRGACARPMLNARSGSMDGSSPGSSPGSSGNGSGGNGNGSDGGGVQSSSGAVAGQGKLHLVGGMGDGQTHELSPLGMSAATDSAGAGTGARVSFSQEEWWMMALCRRWSQVQVQVQAQG